MLLTGLLVKHTIADYLLQTGYMVSNKGRYGHVGGIMHAGLHALLTLPVILILTSPPLATLALILVGEFIIHYHIDWMKEKISDQLNLGPGKIRFWQLHGVDQLLHGLTYVAIVAILFSAQATSV